MSEDAPPERDDAPASAGHDEIDEPGLDINALRRRREVVLTVLALVVILGVAFAAARGLLSSTVVPPRAELAALAERAVRAEMAGSALAFPPQDEYVVTESGEKRLELKGRVQVILGNGATSVYTFDCLLAPDHSGAWHATSLKLRPGY